MRNGMDVRTVRTAAEKGDRWGGATDIRGPVRLSVTGVVRSLTAPVP